MKYKNAKRILPEELIEVLQQYAQGEYIYIPIKHKVEHTTPTEYEMELQKRDEHIYTKSLEGISNNTLSELYHLSESSIRRIIINQRKQYKEMENKVNSILENWNVEGAIKQIYDSAWQVGENYILKVYDDLRMLERNIKINTILNDMSIPVGRIVPTKENTSFTNDEKYYFVLTEKLQE